MSLSLIAFTLFTGACALLAPLAPVWGAVAYVMCYSIGPERQWWFAPARGLGLRLSFLLAGVTALGALLQWRKLHLRKPLLLSSEKLILAFLGIVWLSVAMMGPTVGKYGESGVDHPSVKLTKIVVFLLLMTHVAGNAKNLNRVLWAMVAGALILGLQAYDTPRRAFVSGRLESVGGPDFSDANRLGGYLAGLLFLIGAQFMRSGWFGKIVCFLAGGFAANAIILTRSRGAMVGIGGGALVAAALAPRKHRPKIIAGLILAALGGYYLTDPQFLDRAATITRSEEERDSSALSRLRLAEGTLKMLKDHPLGVGAGNFYQSIGTYVPEYAGRDAHNTFFRCMCELGVPGLAAFVAILLTIALVIRRTIKRAASLPPKQHNEVMWAGYGMLTGLVAVLTYGLTGTLIYTEYLWLLLALPICLHRAVESALAVPETAISADRGDEATQPRRREPRRPPRFHHRAPHRVAGRPS